MRRGSGRRLSSQIFVSQVSILLAVVLVGFGLFAVQERRQLDRQYMDEALQIAQTVADTPEVKTCIAFPSTDCDGKLQSIADFIQRDTASDYVVVFDSFGQSVNGRVPLYGPLGDQIGEVSVGRRVTSVTSVFIGQLPVYGAW